MCFLFFVFLQWCCNIYVGVGNFFFFYKAPESRCFGFCSLSGLSVLTSRCWWSMKTTQAIGKWKGIRIHHFGQWIILSWRQLTNGRHRKSSLPSPYLLKNRAQISYEKRDLLILEQGRELSSWETSSPMSRRVCINRPCENNPYLLLVSSIYFLVVLP